MAETFDLVIIGGGVIGCSIARSVALHHLSLKVCLIEKDLIEKEPALAIHQSGRNSGVVHVGYNQRPGTLKARYVVEGSQRLRQFCRLHHVPLEENGILIVV